MTTLQAIQKCDTSIPEEDDGDVPNPFEHQLDLPWYRVPQVSYTSLCIFAYVFIDVDRHYVLVKLGMTHSMLLL